MKRLLPFVCVGALGLVAYFGIPGSGGEGSDPARDAAVKLFNSLDEDQKKQVFLPLEDKDRYKEIFPATKRPGLAFSDLKPEQKKLAEAAVRSMTSNYGAERCFEVAKQTGEPQRFLTFYGEPGAGKPFAWRVATHHLTLIYAEFGKEGSGEFGPILLGGNPVKNLWDDEDKIAVALYGALTPEEVKSLPTKGGRGSGSPIGKGGVRIGDLNEKARTLARLLFDKRLDVFSPDRRKIMQDILKEEGGLDNLRLAVWGNLDKSFHDGNNYAWRIGNDRVTCDWETLDKNHLHMTIKAKKKAG